MVDKQYEHTSFYPSTVSLTSKTDLDLPDEKTASKFSFPVLAGFLGHQNRDTLSLVEVEDGVLKQNAWCKKESQEQDTEGARLPGTWSLEQECRRLRGNSSKSL